MRYALLLLLAVASTGCIQRASARRPTQHVFVAIDTSGSARNMLGAYARGTSSLANQLEPGSDRLTIFRFDTKPTEIYDGSAPESSEKFKTMLVRNLTPDAKSRGTSPGRLFSMVVAWRKRGAQRHPATVVVYTDGGNDDLSAEGEREYRKAVQELAADPNLKRLALIGVRAGMRESIRERLAPLGDKVIVQGEDEMGLDLSR